MINDIFESTGKGIQSSLYADDGAIWKRGKNVLFVRKAIQSDIVKVERWSYDWGFKISTINQKIMLYVGH